MRCVKGRLPCRTQQELPVIRKGYRGYQFWALGYFLALRGAVTDDAISKCLHEQIEPTDLDQSSFNAL